MKTSILLLSATIAFCSCTNKMKQKEHKQSSIVGTWKLISGTTVRNNDTTTTDYTQGQEMIKIITPTHFAFLRHDLNHGKDSGAVFVAGGGTVKIEEHKYTEQLDYFNVREWEGGTFELNYEIKDDTLVTSAIEKVEKLGINQLNIETLVRLK